MFATALQPATASNSEHESLVAELEKQLDIKFNIYFFEGRAESATSELDAALHDFFRDPAAKSARWFSLDQSAVLAVRLPGTELTAALAEVQEKDRRLAAHATLVVETLAQRKEIERLDEEAESLVEQVAESFEELSLFRSLAKHVELPESSTCPMDMAKDLISELCPVADAEGLSLIVRSNLDDPLNRKSAVGSVSWAKQELLSKPQIESLIGCFREAAAVRPVIRNNIHLDEAGIGLTDLQDLILVEIVSHGQLFGWLAACNRASDTMTLNGREGFTTVQATLLVTAASMLGANFRNLDLLQQKEALFTEMVRALVNALDARDPYTCGHSERVALFAQRIGRQIGLKDHERERIYLSGLLHDLGKIAVPDALLLKPSGLSDSEFAQLSQHPLSGWSILRDLPAMRHILPGVLYHHECFDGSGYPDRLAGDAIPLDGRIIAVCDAYDAMTSDRPYRPGMPHEKAERILRGGAGQQWDPRIIDAFFECVEDIIDIRGKHQKRPATHEDYKRRAEDARNGPAY